jgi:hypothetical protein
MVGEIRIYLLAILISGVVFFSAVSITYSARWGIFAVGLLVGAAAMLLFRLKTDNSATLVSAFRRPRLGGMFGRGDAIESAANLHEHPKEVDEIPAGLQKLLDSATRIASENEALRSDIAQLRQRALRRRPGGTA